MFLVIYIGADLFFEFCPGVREDIPKTQYLTV